MSRAFPVSRPRTTVPGLAAACLLALLLAPLATQGADYVAPEGPPPAAAAVARGNQLYGETCAVCHGGTGQGGNGAKIDLTESPIAMANDGGRQLATLLQAGRPDRGMPARPSTEAEAADLWAKLRSFGFARAGAASGAATASKVDPVLVGDADAGKAFFNGPVGRCNTCHAITSGVASPATNLAGITAKYPDLRLLQSNMLLMGRRYYWSPANGKDVTVTVTYKDGRVLKGYLSSVSDFKVFMRDEAGTETVIERRNGEPKVALVDRLQHHIDLLPLYRDSDIHDLAAYLVTLK